MPAPPRPSREVLFFALKPDGDAADEIARLAELLQHEYDLAGEPKPEEFLHISLNPVGILGDLPADGPALACKAGSLVRLRPFEITLDRCMTFGGARRPLVLTCDQLSQAVIETLFHQLNDTMGAVGLPLLRLTFGMPHLTMLYGGKALPEMPLETPISWIVREVVLLNSHQGEGWHEELGRWPLSKDI